MGFRRIQDEYQLALVFCNVHITRSDNMLALCQLTDMEKTIISNTKETKVHSP